MRLLRRSKPECRPHAFGVQVRPAVLESLHSVALEKLLSEFWAAVLESLPRWASAKRRHLQERRVAQTNRWERPVGRRGVTQRQASASSHSAAGDGATAKLQRTRLVEKVVPLEQVRPAVLESLHPVASEKLLSEF